MYPGQPGFEPSDKLLGINDGDSEQIAGAMKGLDDDVRFAAVLALDATLFAGVHEYDYENLDKYVDALRVQIFGALIRTGRRSAGGERLRDELDAPGRVRPRSTLFSPMNTREDVARMRAGTSTLCREGQRMGSYPLAVAAHIAVGIDCIRRGDLDAAAAALARAAALTRNAGAAVESRDRRAATNVNAEEGETR